MVATSQPLAAQAGLDILKKGGNAIDAAVATAAVLSLVEPMNVGPGGDLFAIIYIAKENKLYTLNASGKAPSGQTLARMNSLGYAWDPQELGARLRHAARRDPDRDRARRRVGLGRSAAPLRHDDVQGDAAAGHRLRRAGLSRLGAHRATTGRLPQGLAARPGDPRAVLHRGRSGFDRHLVRATASRPPPGRSIRNPDLAKTFRILQEKGRDGFYKGEIAQRHRRQVTRARRAR